MKTLKKLVIVGFVLLYIFMLSTFINARGWETDGYDWYYRDESGYLITDTIKSSNGKKYYLGEDGRMVRDYLYEEDSIYYFDESGEMVTNTWVAVDPYQVLDPILYGPTVYLYYFGFNGRAYRAKEDVAKKVIDGKKYLFDSQGRMLSGWINESGEMWNYIDYDTDPFDGFIYYAGDETDGVLREGWVEFDEGSMDDTYYTRDSIWFYFSSITNKKIYSDNVGEYVERKINGKEYAFDSKGVMLMGWEVQPATRWYADEDDDDADLVGALSKKRWNYVVPSKELSEEDYDTDTYRWFYSESNGEIAKNKIKKINGYYYAFDKVGRMKDGLIILEVGSYHFVDKIDLEATEGKDFMITRRYQSAEDTLLKMFDNTKHILYYFDIDDTTNMFGSRKTGTVTIPFADKDYVFATDNLGAIRTIKNRRYYQEGFLLQADPLLTYGIVLDGYMSTQNGDVADRDPEYKGGTSETSVSGNEYYVSQYPSSYTTEWPHFVAVDRYGKKISRKCVAKKDKDNNYWLIGENGTFKKVITVPARYRNGNWYFKSDKYNARTYRTTSAWIPFGDSDANGYTVSIERGVGNYEMYLLDQYAVNFNWVD